MFSLESNVAIIVDIFNQNDLPLNVSRLIGALLEVLESSYCWRRYVFVSLMLERTAEKHRDGGG
jgi:hypothetical protein